MTSLSYRPKPGSIPDEPGVYRFRDNDNVVIYVGKARSLRNRLNSYFTDPNALHPRTFAMVHSASGVDWVTVDNEVEALQLEYSWIKEYEPRFNVKYRDDKSYPYLAITMADEFPRVQVMRGAKRKGTRYFGPFAHAWAIRDTVEQLLRVFPMRSCSPGVFQRHQRMGRPCLLADIGKCSAPCVGRVTADEHRVIADEFARFLSGRTDPYIRDVERRMTEAANKQDYETAARLRDDIAALRRALAKSAVVLPDATDADVIGMAGDELELSFQVFHVRGGRVSGQRAMVVERTVDQSDAELLEHYLMVLYGELTPTGAQNGPGIPRQILTVAEPTSVDTLHNWLASHRGSRVTISVPRRGPKRELLDTVTANARQTLHTHKLKRAGDLTSRGQALEQLQSALDLEQAPLRIECIDISSHHGTDITASIVVFEDGLPTKSQYRKYRIPDHTDDVTAMYQAVARRYAHTKSSEEDKQSDQPRARRYRVGLLVVDGGAPQVAAAAAALADVGATDIPVCGLAKRLEEVWLPEEDDPVILPRRSEALYLLQRVRDEAHRFAITFHRQRRAKRSAASVLDEIPGLGPVRRKALLKQFGSVRKLKAATIDQIAQVPGIGQTTAQMIAERLQSEPPAVAVNLTTGEVLGHADAHE